MKFSNFPIFLWDFGGKSWKKWPRSGDLGWKMSFVWADFILENIAVFLG
jgi:hypothetical protein